MVRTNVIIMGAAGRDFHNFNTFYRNNDQYRVVAFTAAQIPNIEGRVYPPELSGPMYPKGIPIYPEDRIKTIPPLMRMRYFESVQPGLWQIKPEIRKLVHFSRFNLVKSRFSFKKKFFAIFCRNVMLYFDRQTINALIERFYQVTEDQGYLFISLTESLDKTDCPYHYVGPSIYQKRE